MKIFLVSFLTVTLGLFGYLYFYLGFSQDVKNEGLVEETFYILGTQHVGAYHKINAVITEVENWAQKNRVPCPLTFGNYLDNPQIADENRLRSEGGCLSMNPIFSHLKEDSAKFFTRQIPLQKYLKFSFSGSPAISPFKVYPAAEKWFASTNYKRGQSVLEVYEVSGKAMTTHYYFPVAD